MNRCPPLSPLLRGTFAALGFSLALLPALAQEQTPADTGSAARNFPEAALRGKLAFTTGPGSAQLNNDTIRTAPGFRLFSPQNALVMAHTVQGQSFTVNYVIEPSTGLLHTAWILSKAEADLPRKGSDKIQRNFDFASERPAN